MQEQAIKEMDDAVALAPDDLHTRIPRGGALLAGAPHFSDAAAARLAEKAVGDYEKARSLKRQRPAGEHARGELLGGLAIGYRLLDDRASTEKDLKRIVAELPEQRIR